MLFRFTPRESVSCGIEWCAQLLPAYGSCDLYALALYGIRLHKDDDVPLNIRNETVNRLAETLAARKRMNKTDAVRIALENELRRLDEAIPLRQRLRSLQNRVLSRPATGLEADKAFYDELSGNA